MARDGKAGKVADDLAAATIGRAQDEKGAYTQDAEGRTGRSAPTSP
jgi:hypothetical protein